MDEAKAFVIERGFGMDEAREYIDEVRWQFAKTMPTIPHWYTVANWRPSARERFKCFVQLIRAEGDVRPWPRDARNPRYFHTYLNVDEYQYWSMGEPLEKCPLVNRALID